MEKKWKLTKKLYNKNDFNKIFLDITKERNLNLSLILEEIRKDDRFSEKQKLNLYEIVFAYIKNVNEIFINDIEKVYEMGMKKTLENNCKSNKKKGNLY